MKIICLCIVILGVNVCMAQVDKRISTMDFIEVIDGNKAEVIFYYQNNWKALRDKALNKGYIDSYQVLETPLDEELPFQYILITTYLNEEQYKLREEHFAEIIKESGGLKLLNEKKPNEFRRSLFSKEMVRHWQ